MRPALYPKRRMICPAGIAHQEIAKKNPQSAVAPHPKRSIPNDFINCRIRKSVRLLGIAQRKNSGVTTRNGSIRPAGISGA